MEPDEWEIFEQIRESNPDLAGGEPMLNLRDGDEVVAVTLAKANDLAEPLIDALLSGVGMDDALAGVAGEHPLLQVVVAHAAYRWVVLSAFDMHPFQGGAVLDRAKKFLYLVASLRPRGGGSDVR